MEKYIDAEKLKIRIAQIQKEHPYHPYSENYESGCDEGYLGCCDELLSFIDSLQQEQPDSQSLTERSIVWFENIAANAKRLSAGNVSHLGPTIVGMAIRSKEFLEKHKQAQPEVKLEEEIEKGWEELEKDYSPSALDKSYMIVSGLVGEKQFSRIARHFYELGLNARKED